MNPCVKLMNSRGKKDNHSFHKYLLFTQHLVGSLTWAEVVASVVCDNKGFQSVLSLRSIPFSSLFSHQAIIPLMLTLTITSLFLSYQLDATFRKREKEFNQKIAVRGNNYLTWFG